MPIPSTCGRPFCPIQIKPKGARFKRICSNAVGFSTSAGHWLCCQSPQLCCDVHYTFVSSLARSTRHSFNGYPHPRSRPRHSPRSHSSVHQASDCQTNLGKKKERNRQCNMYIDGILSVLFGICYSGHHYRRRRLARSDCLVWCTSPRVSPICLFRFLFFFIINIYYNLSSN